MPLVTGGMCLSQLFIENSVDHCSDTYTPPKSKPLVQSPPVKKHWVQGSLVVPGQTITPRPPDFLCTLTSDLPILLSHPLTPNIYIIRRMRTVPKRTTQYIMTMLNHFRMLQFRLFMEDCRLRILIWHHSQRESTKLQLDSWENFSTEYSHLLTHPIPILAYHMVCRCFWSVNAAAEIDVF